MNTGARVGALALVLLAGLFSNSGAYAAVSDCGDASLLEQSFSSGAAWALCADVDEHHALEVTSVHYRAPGGILRSVLEQAHVGQVLMDYHDEEAPRAQIIADSLNRLLAMNTDSCDGTPVTGTDGSALICSRVQDNRVLAKYSQRPSLQSQRWELSSAMQRDGLVWTVSISFTEDGQITPSVSLSGRARQTLASPAFSSTLPASNRFLARATVLATWRLVFNLDDGDFDAVQQFEYPLDVILGNRRPMQVRDLDTELFTTVNRNSFRGWRINDPRGPGYYLDPSNSGFNYIGSDYNWARFDVALTKHTPCERYALNNQSRLDDTTSCGSSLDDFVNGETLKNTHPVLWFSQSRTFNPTDEDWPAISNFYQSFTILPFDWTPNSPFEVIE